MNFLKGTLLVSVLVLIMSCATDKKTAEDYPRFWTWMGYGENNDWDATFKSMKEIGIDGLLLNAPKEGYEKVIPIADKYGIDVHAWVWTVNNGGALKEHPEWYSVNRDGKSLADSGHMAYVDYYKFLCPAIPEARQYVIKNIEELCQIEGLKGISIDYHRFVDVILPKALWPSYGIVQDKEYAEWDYGYNPVMRQKFKELHDYDPMDIEDPENDEKWLQFRCDQITDFANEIADVVHKHGKLMSASPFPTPSMARKMVRQDWGKWDLDLVFPMVYHSFYNEGIEFIEDCNKENAVAKNPKTVLFCGMHEPDFDNDTLRIDRAMQVAMQNGAQGIALYTFHGLDSVQRAEFKKIVDSIKQNSK